MNNENQPLSVRQAFDEGSFSEEEIRVIKRILPSAYAAKARRLNRKEFFQEISVSGCCKNLNSIKKTLYNIGLSKREKIFGTEPIKQGPLSLRKI